MSLSMIDPIPRYDENRRRMDPGFPRPISMDWPIMRVNAAFELQGRNQSERPVTNYNQ